ncbi:NmrA family NAD(P)-binding protein [Streptomyces sp. ME01-24h]|nr:NmrA family NAD(P)-binding protein [Streptomyces sp. ME19-03-3]MDX3355817.1 NmrA family NAD(P)-binding protein [Streptomyces sp. ME01-24h]
MTSPILVVGGTGAVGGATIPALLARGGTVRALVRSKARAAGLLQGVELFAGDLTDERSVREALEGVESAFYVSPHVDEEVEIAETFVAACEANGTRLVFGGFHVPDEEVRTSFGQMVPSYQGKLKVGVTIAESSASPVILNLTNFAQNDEPFREDILSGVYPLPIAEGGANRIDLRDAGEIAAKALLDKDFATGFYGLNGAEMLNGAEAAAVWAETLGRPVEYLGADGDWKAVFAKRLSGRKLTDWISSFEKFISLYPVPTDADQVRTTTELLGRAPRSYRDYVNDMARLWQA